MCDSRRPTEGVESPESTRPYLVYMEDRYDEHDRFTVRIAAAYGPKDATGQAQFDHPGYVALRAEEVREDAA